MDRATTDTAAMVRRVVRRTLTILGGSVAGTAIAWVISSASASAETPCEAAGKLSAVTGVEQLAPPVSDVVCAVELIDLGDDAAQVADEFGRNIADQVGRVPQIPVEVGEPGRSDQPGALPAPGGGAYEPPSLVQPVGEPSAAAPAGTAGRQSAVDNQAGDATERALAGGMTRRGSPEPAPVPPGQSGPRQAPASVPASGSSGHTGGGADSPTAAAFSSSAGQLGLTVGRVRLAGETRRAGEPGAAPGVTPD